MAFNGSIESDFLKLVDFPDTKKPTAIDFGATDFISLRQALINYIKLVYPLDYQNFSESDLGMMLIELVAYMGSVMSMKADMLANENYLATSRNRNNVKKLLELIGVRMRGPISAMANARLTLPAPASQNEIILTADKRVVSITSPEDGKPLNFTLYKIDSLGTLEPPTENGSLSLYATTESSDTSSVWSNLALLEGAFVTKTGTFNSTDMIKSISLDVGPVIENSVNVYVITPISDASGAWTQVQNLYYSNVNDNNFEVVYNDNYNATIYFGDGIISKSPPAGADYFVTYRVGGGTRGNIGNEIINSILEADNQQGTLENVSLATGGQDAETVAKAKKYAPLTFKRQDRLVTIEDYSSFCNSFIGTTGSTGKGRAVVRDAYSSANIIDLYLLQVASPTQVQQATVTYKQELLLAMQEKKMLTDEIVIVDGLIRALDLIITIRIDNQNEAKEETIKAKVRAKLLEFFNVVNFDFGKPLVLAEVNRECFSIPEVRFSTVDNLSDNVIVDFNEIIQLNNLIINVAVV